MKFEKNITSPVVENKDAKEELIKESEAEMSYDGRKESLTSEDLAALKQAEAVKDENELESVRSSISEASKETVEVVESKIDEYARSVKALESRMKDNPEQLKVAKFSLTVLDDFIARGEDILQKATGNNAKEDISKQLRTLKTMRYYFVDEGKGAELNPLSTLAKAEAFGAGRISAELKKEYLKDNKVGFLKSLTLSDKTVMTEYLKKMSKENSELIGGKIDEDKINQFVTGHAKSGAELGASAL